MEMQADVITIPHQWEHKQFALFNVLGPKKTGMRTSDESWKVTVLKTNQTSGFSAAKKKELGFFFGRFCFSFEYTKIAPSSGENETKRHQKVQKSVEFSTF